MLSHIFSKGSHPGRPPIKEIPSVSTLHWILDQTECQKSDATSLRPE